MKTVSYIYDLEDNILETCFDEFDVINFFRFDSNAQRSVREAHKKEAESTPILIFLDSKIEEAYNGEIIFNSYKIKRKLYKEPSKPLFEPMLFYK